MSRLRTLLLAAGLLTSGAPLLASCAGGANYPREEAVRAPETCAAQTAVPECQQRLQALEQRLTTTLGPTNNSIPTAGPPAPPAAGSVASGSPSIAPPVEQDMVPSGNADELAPPTPSSPQPPDCPAARDLRDRICQLSDAICALAAHADAAPETATTCDSARASCDRARTDVARVCPGSTL